MKYLTQEHITGEARFYVVKHLKQEHISGEARISVVKNFNTDQYTCYRNDTEWYTWCRAEKEEQYSIETIDYSTFIKINRRISLQMITPMSTWHYDIHLGNNDGKQDDNVKSKKGIGYINPYSARKLNKEKNVSIGLGPGEALRSLETSPI